MDSVEERLDGSWVVIADGPEDHENAMDMVRLLRSIPPVRSSSARLPPQAADGPMLEQRVELFLDVLDTVRWTAVLVPMDTFGRNGGRRPEASRLRGVHASPSPLHQRELA
jgi:hypothetical protein